MSAAPPSITTQSSVDALRVTAVVGVNVSTEAPTDTATGPSKSATFVPCADPLWSVTVGGPAPVVELSFSSTPVRV